MASAYELFETDEKLEQEGIWADYGEFRVKLAHAGGTNKKFSNLLNAKMKPYERLLAAGTMDEEVAAQIMREVYAKTIILAFEVKKVNQNDVTYVPGVPSKSGEVFPFCEEQVIRICKELPKLFTDLQRTANDFANYRTLAMEETIKN